MTVVNDCYFDTIKIHVEGGSDEINALPNTQKSGRNIMDKQLRLKAAERSYLYLRATDPTQAMANRWQRFRRSKVGSGRHQGGSTQCTCKAARPTHWARRSHVRTQEVSRGVFCSQRKAQFLPIDQNGLSFFEDPQQHQIPRLI